MIHFEPGDSIAAQVELQRHPFQGPDKLGRTLKCGVGTGYEWTYIAPAPIKTWTPDKKASKAQAAHVEMSQRAFRERGVDIVFRFWALAPTKTAIRNRHMTKTTEFVWLTCSGTPGVVVHALVDKETDEIYWRDNSQLASDPARGSNHPLANQYPYKPWPLERMA